jgi:endonuclease/exonuclease/phosphatase (EEP) superfamily protein YafD
VAVRGIVKQSITLLAAASIAASLVPLFALQWWLFDLFTHFRVQLIVSQLLLVVLLAVSRRPAWTLSIAVCCVLNAYAIKDYLLPSVASLGDVAPAATTGRTLRLMTVNVFGHNDDLRKLFEFMEATSPDVVIIQEYREGIKAQLGRLASSHPYRFELPRRDYWGIALFSRLPLTNVREFPLRGASAIDARLEVDGRPLRVLGVHLTTPLSATRTAQRAAQLDELAAVVNASDDSFAMLGDFNLTPFSPYFTALLARTGLRDALAGNGPSFTWPAFFPLLGIPIDHCLVSQSWRIIDYRRGPDIGSDHYPIVVSIQYSGMS